MRESFGNGISILIIPSSLENLCPRFFIYEKVIRGYEAIEVN